MGDYGSGQSQQQTSLPPLPKPQAIIHLPNNVYAHKITDTIKLDHEQLSNYLSSINYLPDTIHKHAQLLAQLDENQIKQIGQSIGPNQLPLISLTVPDNNKNSDYNSGDAQMKINDDYSAPPQDYAPQQQSNSGYQQQQQQDYNSQQSPPPAPVTKKNCNKNSGYQQQQNSGYAQQQQQNSQNSQEYGSGNSNGYNSNGDGGNSYNNEAPQVEYQSGGGGKMENNNYDSGGNSYYSENSSGGGNSYENSDNAGGGGQSYSSNNNNNQEYGNSNSNEESGNYESSPFDYNFVQEILKHVMQQLEQLQIDPDNLNAYGKMEENSNEGGNNNYNSGGNSGGYESNSNSNNQQQQGGGYEVQGNSQGGIQLVDRPEGQEINYGYSINHGSYEQPNEQSNNNNYEPSYTSSSTTSQATSYHNINAPGIILDNKIPINSQEIKDSQHPSTITYQMPTINLELPKKQIDYIMKTISSNKKGRYAQPIMIKASHFKLPSNLNLGKIKQIAFIKSSKLNGLKELPYFNSNQLLSSNSNLNNYKLIPSMSKKEETKFESNPVLSAYGYGINLPSSKLYSSSSNKKSIILPLKNRSKRIGNSYSTFQTASSNIKSIISALPKISKKSIQKAVATKIEKK